MHTKRLISLKKIKLKILIQIGVVFHLEEGRIIHSYREYRKPAPDQKGQLLDLSQNFVVSFN
jgi:hypothetical protein